MFEIGSRAQKLPAPPSMVWGSLAQPQRKESRPWLSLASNEVAPTILVADEPHRVVWSSLWPSRPNDQVHFDLSAIGFETMLKFTLLTPDEPPDQSTTGHLRYRLNYLLFADLRFSYGQ